MPHPFVFLCPNCFAEDTLQNAICKNCGIRVLIDRDALTISGKSLSVPEYYSILIKNTAIQQSNPPGFVPENSLSSIIRRRKILRTSRPAVLRQGRRRLPFHGYHRLFHSTIEIPRNIARGRLLISSSRVVFVSPRKTFTWRLTEFTCITTNGHYFEFKIKEQTFFQIHFLEESALKYELVFRKLLDATYGQSRRRRILEYQPHLRFDSPEASSQYWNPLEIERQEKSFRIENLLMTAIAKMVKRLLRLSIRVEIIGKENWQPQTKGFVILNHQSGFDPFIIAAFLDHRVAFLTKSTSFSKRLPRTFLRWARGIPTTRYQGDPAVVMAIRSLLKRNIKVGVFPEGERCWNGELQPFKRSFIKLLMASREAIYPVIIQNAFGFWPRWSKLPRRTKVRLTVGAPFCLIPGGYSVDEQSAFLEEYFQEVLNREGKNKKSKG